jgi:hypothetical protein
LSCHTFNCAKVQILFFSVGKIQALLGFSALARVSAKTKCAWMCGWLFTMRHNGQVSSRQGEFHPEPLTEPYVIVSNHTALLTWHTKIAHPFSSWQYVHQISPSLCSISITETSPLLRTDPSLCQASLFRL